MSRKLRNATARGWLQRLVRSFTSTMYRRRRTIPGLLESDRGLSSDLAANNILELFKGIDALGKTTNCISIVCGQGIAMVIDAEDPMRRVIGVAHHVRPRCGKTGIPRLFEKSVQVAKLNEHRAGGGVISRFVQLIWSLRQWPHRPNETKMSDGHRERVWAAVKASETLETRTRSRWPFAPSPG